VARIGTKERPAIVRVQTEERAEEVLAQCEANGIKVIVGLEPDRPEDISDVGRVLSPVMPVTVGPKVGRNDPCPCGSGKKYKKCCAGSNLA